MEKSNQLKAANFESSKEFLATLEKATFIENPLNELASSPTAIVYYGTPCCTLKCCIPCNCLKCKCDCGDFFAYNTLTVNGDVQKYLFKNIARLNCSIFCTDLINRFDYSKVFLCLLLTNILPMLESKALKWLKKIIVYFLEFVLIF